MQPRWWWKLKWWGTRCRRSSNFWPMTVEIVGFGAAIVAISLAVRDVELNRQALELNAQATSDATLFQAWGVLSSRSTGAEDPSRQRAFEYLSTLPGGLRDVTLEGSRFRNLKLQNATFRSLALRNGLLDNPQFSECEFSNCSFPGTQIVSAEFVGCLLLNVDFSLSPSWKMEFRDCALVECRFPAYGRTAFVDVSMVGCDLTMSGLSRDFIVGLDDWRNSDLADSLSDLELSDISIDSLRTLLLADTRYGRVDAVGTRLPRRESMGTSIEYLSRADSAWVRSWTAAGAGATGGTR